MAPKFKQQLCERDRLLTRPAHSLLPSESPKKPRGEPADPKPFHKPGHGYDPKWTDIGYTA